MSPLEYLFTPVNGAPLFRTHGIEPPTTIGFYHLNVYHLLEILLIYLTMMD